MNAPISPVSAAGLSRPLKGAWLAVAIMALVNALNTIDRVLISVLALGIKKEFLLSDSQIGVLMMGFGVAYAILGLPLGRAADRGNRTRLITLVVALWSGATALCGIATSYVWLVIGRMGVAVGEAGYLPAAYAMVSDYFPPRLRALGHGLINCASASGAFIGMALGGWLAATHGWRAAFLMLGIPGLAVAVLVWFCLKDPPRGQKEELDYGAAGEAHFRAVIRRLFGNRLYMWMVVGTACNTFSAVGMVQWLPSFFTRVHAMPMATVGLFIGGVFGIGMLAGQIVGTVAATRLGRRGIFVPLQFCIWANLLLVPLYLGAFWVGDVRLSMAFTAAAAFMCTFPHSAQTSGYQTSLPPDVRSTGHAVLALMVSVVGMGIAPLIIGMLSDYFQGVGSPQPLRPALSCALVLFVISGFSGWKAYRLGIERERGDGSLTSPSC